MNHTTVNSPINKILAAIQRKGKATVSDIKRSIAEFNQAGGAEKLRCILADLVSNGSLTIHTDKSGNGQTVESYCLATSDASSGSNDATSNVGNGNNMKITITFDIVIEGWQDIVSSLINADCGNDGNNERNATLAAVESVKPNNPDDEDDDIPRECMSGQSTPSTPTRRRARFTAPSNTSSRSSRVSSPTTTYSFVGEDDDDDLPRL